MAADPAFVMEVIPEPVHEAVREAVEGAIRCHNPKKDDEEKFKETVRRAARGAADGSGNAGKGFPSAETHICRRIDEREQIASGVSCKLATRERKFAAYHMYDEPVEPFIRDEHVASA